MFRDYAGKDTDERIHAFVFDQPGAYPPQLTEIHADARVFAQFLWAAAGEFSSSTSLSGGDWRAFPAVIRTARRLGAERLTENLETAWREIQTFPPDLLDDFDARKLVWSPDEIEMLRTAGEAARPHRITDAETGERISHLLNYAWQARIDLTPLSRPVQPKGSSDYRLINALAAYLASLE